MILRLTIVFLLATTSPLFAASVTLQSWNLATVVDDGFLEARDDALSVTVENPFQDTQAVSIGDSFATTLYDFSWQAESASFLFDLLHATADIPDGTIPSRSTSSSTVIMRAENDLLLTVDTEYSYHSLGSEYFARSGVIVADIDADIRLLDETEQDGPAFLGPSAGTFSFHDTAVIPAGTNFGFSYSMSLTTFGGGSSAIGQGAGHVYITMQVIPEPASAILLCAFAGFAVCRRRRLDA